MRADKDLPMPFMDLYPEPRLTILDWWNSEADLARPTTLWGRLTAEPDLVATGVAPKRARVDDGASGGFSFGFG